jgi:SET domain-containing protein
VGKLEDLVFDDGRLIVKRSGVQGEGLFAGRAFRKGWRVVEFDGVPVPLEEVDETLGCIQIGENQYLVEDPDEPWADDFLNHSCSPNVGFTDGTLMLRALRPIAKGDEILLDYSTAMNEPGWSFRCRCAAPRCRGRVQSYCDLTPSVKRRLRPFTLEYLRKPVRRKRSRARAK